LTDIRGLPEHSNGNDMIWRDAVENFGKYFVNLRGFFGSFVLSLDGRDGANRWRQELTESTP
jgi:hypothetical protein